MGASLTSLLLWFHSLSLILVLKASLSHLSSSCVTLSSSAEFEYVCAAASGRETFERAFQSARARLHVRASVWEKRGELNVCVPSPRSSTSANWLMNVGWGGFMILLKLVTLFKAPFIQRVKSQREKDRLRGKREREAAGWVKF